MPNGSAWLDNTHSQLSQVCITTQQDPVRNNKNARPTKRTSSRQTLCFIYIRHWLGWVADSPLYVKKQQQQLCVCRALVSLASIYLHTGLSNLIDR